MRTRLSEPGGDHLLWRSGSEGGGLGGGRGGGGVSGTIDAALDKARDELYMNRKIMDLDPERFLLDTATQCCKIYCDTCDGAGGGSGGS